MPSYRTGYLLNLSPEQREKLDREAKRLGVSRADVLREGLQLIAQREPNDRQPAASGT